VEVAIPSKSPGIKCGKLSAQNVTKEWRNPMACTECPEPSPEPSPKPSPEPSPKPSPSPISSPARYTLMPRHAPLHSFLRQAGLTVNEDCVIESDVPLEGLRQDPTDTRLYHLDYVPCTWKMLNIVASKFSTDCLMRLDTSQCESCPNRCE